MSRQQQHVRSFTHIARDQYSNAIADLLVSSVVRAMDKKNIIVIGASLAGLLQSHSILKHIIPKFPSYRVVLINPSADFYFVVGGPRAIIDGKLVADEKVFLLIADGFQQYDPDSYEIIQGMVVHVDLNDRTLEYRDRLNGSSHLAFAALVFASGGRTPSPLFTPYPSTTQTKDALQRIRNALPKARTVIKSGGGPCGVECAGEIGHFLNGNNGSASAQVIIVTSNSRLLPSLSEAAAARAEQYLHMLGASVIYGAKVIKTVPEDAGRTLGTLDQPAELYLNDGRTLEADIYIPAWHGTPTTSYVPAKILTPSGHVHINQSTLRVDDAGPRVYALGECSSDFKGGSKAITAMTGVITFNLRRDVYAAEGRTGQGAAKDTHYAHNAKATQFVPVGRDRGVGQFNGWWLPSWAVWILKSRTYMIGIASWYLYGTLVRWEL
ncbi:hypothetical protein LTR95_008557 [Oleoguttula sp. CCFEE 5521]